MGVANQAVPIINGSINITDSRRVVGFPLSFRISLIHHHEYMRIASVQFCGYLAPALCRSWLMMLPGCSARLTPNTVLPGPCALTLAPR